MRGGGRGRRQQRPFRASPQLPPPRPRGPGVAAWPRRGPSAGVPGPGLAAPPAGLRGCGGGGWGVRLALLSAQNGRSLSGG